MKQIFVRLDRCTGCRTCELECALAHSASQSIYSALFERPKPRRRLFVEAGEAEAVPVLCRHCEEAACLSACISGALYRDAASGAVRQHADRCVGCWTCVMVCPYGAVGRQIDGRSIAVKCDRCPERTAPACVDACPTRALVYAEVEEFAASRRRAVAAVAGG